MSDKFQNKYRISSSRLQNWNYGSNAMYFVTICTKNREYYFGEIVESQMELSEIGKIANHFWNEIPNHFPFVELGENVETPKLGVSTTTTTIDITNNPKHQRTINASHKWNPETLGVIINQYKRIVTINARRIHAGFAWQSRFHDHIIRNDESFQRISNYIVNNPSKWTDDKFFK